MDHCGHGFRHVPVLPRTWMFWAVSDSRRPSVVLKTTFVRNSQGQPHGRKFSPCNYASISDPNQSLLNKHPYFLPAPILIRDNVCNLGAFCLYKPLSFWILAECNPTASWISVSWAAVLRNPQQVPLYFYQVSISDILVNMPNVQCNL